MIFEPLDFISKLSALVPVPRVNLTRYHGVFAPNSKHRADIIIKLPDQGNNKDRQSEEGVRTKGEKRAAMTWAQCLKRAFKIDIEVCEVCKGAVKVIACVIDPVVINKILSHLKAKESNQIRLPANRGPPKSFSVSGN